MGVARPRRRRASSTASRWASLDRLLYALGDLLVYGPLRNVLGMSRVRVAYTAGEAIGPDLFGFYRSIGINLKQLYGSTETCGVRLHPARRPGEARHRRARRCTGVELRFTPRARAADPLARPVPGVLQEPRRRRARRRTPRAGSTPATPATSTPTATSRSSTGRRTSASSPTARCSRRSTSRTSSSSSPTSRKRWLRRTAATRSCAFINIDLEAVGNWAEKRSMPYSGYTDLAARDEVYELVRECVEQVNADLARRARARRTRRSTAS